MPLLLFWQKHKNNVSFQKENNQSSLAPEIKRRLAFEWTQPVIADFCRRHGEQYPELDENGEIVDVVNWHLSVKARLKKSQI